jgi:hypothetical protein
LVTPSDPHGYREEDWKMSSMLCAAGRLRPMLVAPLLAVGLIVAGCGFAGTKTTTTTVTRTVTTQAAGVDQFDVPTSVAYFGEPVSTTAATLPKVCMGARCHRPKGYVLVVKPEFFLNGATASAAAAADSSCGLACPPLPDDYLVIPAGTKNLTLALPATTKGTVISFKAGNDYPTKVTAAEFAALVGGATTPKLFEPLSGGVWFTVANDNTVSSFAQQYRP